MEAVVGLAITHANTPAPRRGRRARLVGAVLLGTWAIYLAVTNQLTAALLIGFIAAFMGASYAARLGDPTVRRGSFLIAGALFFCAYFLVVFLSAGGACVNQDSCEGEGLRANVALIALAATTAGAAIAEALLGFRPSRRRALWTRRFAVSAFVVIGLSYLAAAVFSL